MPATKNALNGFQPKRASEIVGLSVHMLNYLARHEYLVPHYGKAGGRGSTRHYSFRDLIVARIVAKLLDAGLEISRLKSAIAQLATQPGWAKLEREGRLRLLATDGKNVFFVQENGALSDVSNGQLTFAFVLDVASAQADVEAKLTVEQKALFTYANRELRYA